MKNWSVIITVVVFLMTGLKIQAQHQPDVIYGDTMKVVVGNYSPLSNDHFFIGKVSAYDPENQSLEYFIFQLTNKPLFTIDRKFGHIYTRRKYLPYLCDVGTFNIKVWVTDGQQSTSASILVKFESSH
ncbi:MAG: cadherin repeat domain-containing protein [Bacteroidetes bacterium]|nr:cadherin repeat domain-containing protein [Bacteroidota bacterium]